MTCRAQRESITIVGCVRTKRHRAQGASAAVGQLFHRHRQRHANRSHRHERARDRRSADRRRATRWSAAPSSGTILRWSAADGAPARVQRAQVIITTGGTGITSRDSTIEAVDALLEKRLEGFGELFRMLSYEQIGAAAMMTRATAGLAAGRIVVSLPARKRPSGWRWKSCSCRSSAISCSRPRSRHRSETDLLRPVHMIASTISLEEARRRLAANVRPVERTEHVASPTPPAASRPPTSARPLPFRRFRDPRWTAMP